MTKTRACRAILCLAGMTSPLWANAVPLPTNWQMLPTSQQETEKGLPSALQAPLLAKNQRSLPQVELLVALPFDQVLPVVDEQDQLVGCVDRQAIMWALSPSGAQPGWQGLPA